MMHDFLKDIQSIGRGIRNAESGLAQSITETGRFVIMDMVSQAFEPLDPTYVRHFKNQHYWSHDPMKGKWTYHATRPNYEQIRFSDKVIARGVDGNFFWYKDRRGNCPRDLTEEELKDLTMIIISAEEITRSDDLWIDIASQRSIGSPIKKIF